jgi:hypothetical protein
MPPRLTSAERAALQPGDRVSRLASPGVWETAPVARLTATQVVVTWTDGTTTRYWRESGTRTDCPGEQLREPEPDPRMTPERWREVLHVHLRDEMQRHQLTEVEEIALGTALADERSEAYRVLHNCARVCFEPLDAAALIVGTVLAQRLAKVQQAPAREKYQDPLVATVPDWAQEVASG